MARVSEQSGTPAAIDCLAAWYGIGRRTDGSSESAVRCGGGPKTGIRGPIGIRKAVTTQVPDSGCSPRPWDDPRLNGATPGDQVDDQNDQRDDQQNMNQAAGNVQSKAEKPEDKKDYKDRPKHVDTSF